jgi:glutaredoxin
MWFHREVFRARTVTVLLILLSACKKNPPSAVSGEQPPREVKKDSTLFFTYLEANGMFATTDKAENVPEATRRLVRIMGRGKGEPARLNDLNVEVVDVRELLAKGRTQPRVMLREAFESSAFTQLVPGDSCLLAGPHGPPLSEEPGRKGPADEPPLAIVYGTRWCKACQETYRYLVANLIPYVAKDLEQDASAAHELAEKATRLGIPQGRVPVIDVRGRLLVGFDETRLNGFLADW